MAGETKVGRLVTEIDGDLSGLRKAISEAQGSIKQAGQAFTSAGRTLTLGLTAPLAAIGAIAIKSSIDFESAFAGVRKTVDATEEEFAVLREGIRDMAKHAPASAVEISRVAEAAGQLGIQKEAILAFSKVMIDLGETTNLTADEAATSFAQIANVMQLPQDQFDRMGAALVDLGNKGASTEADIIEMAKRIAGAGATVGLTTADVLGLAAALANVGINAESGGTSISRVMVSMFEAVATGGKKLEEFGAVAGMSAEEFAQAFRNDPAQAIAAFIEGLGQMNEEGINVFATLKELKLNEIRVRDALLRTANAGDVFSQALEVSNTAWEENTALTVEAGRRYETTAAKLEVMRNRATDMAITLGDALVPILMSIMDLLEPIIAGLAKATEAFAKLPKPVQEIIVAFALVAAAIGPVLMAIGAIASGISALGAVIGLFTAGGALAGLAPLLIAAFPVVLIVAAIAAIAAAIYIFRDDIWNAFQSIYDAISEPLGKVIAFVKKNWREVAVLIAGPFAPLVLLATDGFGIRSALIGAFKDVVAFLSTLPGIIGGALTSAFETVKSVVVGAVTSLLDFLVENVTAHNIGYAIAASILWPILAIREAVQALYPIVKTFFTETLPTAITEGIPQLTSKIATGIAGAVSSAHAAVSTAARNLAVAIVTQVGNGLSAGAQAVTTFFTETLPNFITESIPNAVTAALKLGETLVVGIYDGMKAVWEWIEGVPGEIGDAFKSGFEAMKDLWENIGKDIVYGVWDGIKSLKDWFKRQVENFFKGIYEGAKDFLGINSPSKLFAGIGQNIMRGLEVGLADSFKHDVMPMMAGAARTISAFNPGLGVEASYSPGGFALASAGDEGTNGGVGGSAPGGFNFQVNELNVYQKDDREIRDVAFGVQATMQTEMRRRGILG